MCEECMGHAALVKGDEGPATEKSAGASDLAGEATWERLQEVQRVHRATRQKTTSLETSGRSRMLGKHERALVHQRAIVPPECGRDDRGEFIDTDSDIRLARGSSFRRRD